MNMLLRSWCDSLLSPVVCGRMGAQLMLCPLDSCGCSDYPSCCFCYCCFSTVSSSIIVLESTFPRPPLSSAFTFPSLPLSSIMTSTSGSFVDGCQVAACLNTTSPAPKFRTRTAYLGRLYDVLLASRLPLVILPQRPHVADAAERMDVVGLGRETAPLLVGEMVYFLPVEIQQVVHVSGETPCSACRLPLFPSWLSSNSRCFLFQHSQPPFRLTC